MKKLSKKTSTRTSSSTLVNPDRETKLQKEHRCVKCNKLLGIQNFIVPSFDVKCTRCGTINQILKDLKRQVIFTDKTGKILYVNEEVEKVTGYSSKEILGNRPSLWGKQMKKEFYKDLWRKILKEKKTVTVEVANKTKSGRIYSAILRISPRLDNNGEVEFFLGIETTI